MASSLVMFKKLNSVKTKIIFSIIVPIFGVVAALSFALLNVTDKLIEEHIIPQYDQNLSLGIYKLNNLIDGELINEAKTSTERQKDLQKILTEFQNENGFENAYVLTNDGSKEVILALGNADDYFTSYAFNAEQASAFKTSEIVLTDMYEDDYGKHKSTYLQVPGTDSIMGLDVNASYINGIYKTQLGIIAILGAIAIVFNAIVAFLIARNLLNPTCYLVRCFRYMLNTLL